MTVAAAILAPAGAVLVFLAAVGVMRFPDVPTRLHAATKAATAGFALVVVAAGAALGPGPLAVAVLIAAFQVLTAPIAAHALGRAALPEPEAGGAPPASFPTAARIAGITAAWVALWGEPSPANLVGGVLVAAAVSAAGREPGGRLRLRPWAALRFGAAATSLLVRSTISVAAAAVGPARLVDPVVVRVPLDPASPSALVVTANTLSLTPGSLTLAIDPAGPALVVHLIRPDEGAAAAIARLHRLAAAALPAPAGSG